MGVIVAGTLILVYEWTWIDPAITLLIAGYILWLAFTEIGSSIRVLMMGTPEDLDVAKVVQDLRASATFAAAEADRSLKLFFTHTGERATITFKRDGRFDPKGLAQINRLLRDWRKKEPARMDPRLLDLVWEVYDRAEDDDDAAPAPVRSSLLTAMLPTPKSRAEEALELQTNPKAAAQSRATEGLPISLLWRYRSPLLVRRMQFPRLRLSPRRSALFQSSQLGACQGRKRSWNYVNRPPRSPCWGSPFPKWSLRTRVTLRTLS